MATNSTAADRKLAAAWNDIERAYRVDEADAVAAVASAPAAFRVRVWVLCQGEEGHGGGSRRRSVPMFPTLFGRTAPPEPLRGSGGLGGRVGSGGAYLNAVGVTGASVVTQFCLPSADSNARSPATPI